MPASNPAKLNHIGIAVKNLPRVQELLDCLGLSIKNSERVTEQKVVTHFAPLPKEVVNLEFLEPFPIEGEVAGSVETFLTKRGPGIHHLSFEVERGNLDIVCDKLTKKGFKLIYPQPRLGAHQMRINFVHPSTAEGLLIEIMEPSH